MKKVSNSSPTMEEKTPLQLKGVSRNRPCYKELLCPHGKPGNGWFCPDPGCSGEGLCKHKKHKQSCKECEPAQCRLCNNGRIYAWGALSSHIYKNQNARRRAGKRKSSRLRFGRDTAWVHSPLEDTGLSDRTPI